MIALSTRSLCDLCGQPATVSVEPGLFLCAECASFDPDSEVPVEQGNAPAASSASPGPMRAAAGAINSVSPAACRGALPSGERESSVTSTSAVGEFSSRIPCDVGRRQHGPGPSSVTGMSVDRSNAGGEHEEVAPRPISASEAPAAFETTSLTANGAIVDTSHSGTGPGASGPERDFFGATDSLPQATPSCALEASAAGLIVRSVSGATAGETAPNSNSGDGLGNLEPGSITWGERAALTAPSGRADESATGPAVAGILSPDPMSPLPTVEMSVNCGGARSPLAPPPFSSDFDIEVAALEVEWLDRGICMNATTFLVSVVSASKSKSEIVGA